MTSSGKRYEIIVLECKRNNDGTIKDLYKLKDYFKSKNNNYSIVSFEYGRLSKSLVKTLDTLLKKDSFKNAGDVLFKINSVWIDNKKISSLYFEEMAYKSDFKKIMTMLGLNKK
jgi:hypothetical protein